MISKLGYYTVYTFIPSLSKPSQPSHPYLPFPVWNPDNPDQKGENYKLKKKSGINGHSTLHPPQAHGLLETPYKVKFTTKLFHGQSCHVTWNCEKLKLVLTSR